MVSAVVVMVLLMLLWGYCSLDTYTAVAAVALMIIMYVYGHRS